MLDPEAFTLEPDNIFWRFHATDRLGQFDIAVPANEDCEPDTNALLHLESALDKIDALYAAALAGAEAGWQARYKAPLRDRSAWSLIRLFADAGGRLVLTLHEGEFDTYCVWDVAFIDGVTSPAVQRPYGPPHG